MLVFLNSSVFLLLKEFLVANIGGIIKIIKTRRRSKLALLVPSFYIKQYCRCIDTGIINKTCKRKKLSKN